MAAGHSVDPAAWQITFDELMHRIAGRFGRMEPRRTARAYLSGLLSDTERKTAGAWPSMPDTPDRKPCSASFARRAGRPTKSAMTCEIT